MSVVLSVEQTGPCERQLRVEVPAPAVEAELARVAQEYRQQARLPGFRKGKVPVEVVRRRFGEDIERETVERLVPRYWRQAQAETRLEPLLPPRIEEVAYQPGEPLTFRAVVETRPEVRLGELGPFALPDFDATVSDEEVERALGDLRRQAARWVPVDRPAARGDLVEGDLTEPAATGAGVGQRVAFEVGDANVWDELSLAVIAASAGQAVEFSRRGGEEGTTGERHYRLSLASVRERELPAVDDALAQRVGEFASLAALREDLGRRLAMAKQREGRRLRERALLEQLRDRHPMPLPAGVVEHEVEHLLQEYAEGLRLQGVDPQRSELDWSALAGEVKPQAERRVHARLLLDAAAEQLALRVSDEELEQALAALGRVQGRRAHAVRQALDRSGRLSELRAQLGRDKTLRRLLGEDIHAAESAAPAAAPAAGEE
ncbi:MAG: trigger factor [Thermoanaerobaculia bacterium]